MDTPNHSKKRRDTIVENLQRVIKIVKNGGSLVDGSGMQIKELHDMSRDLDMLTLHASRWEEYCRDNNHNPYNNWADK